jgi:hypothetical protein
MANAPREISSSARVKKTILHTMRKPPGIIRLELELNRFAALKPQDPLISESVGSHCGCPALLDVIVMKKSHRVAVEATAWTRRCDGVVLFWSCRGHDWLEFLHRRPEQMSVDRRDEAGVICHLSGMRYDTEMRPRGDPSMCAPCGLTCMYSSTQVEKYTFAP